MKLCAILNHHGHTANCSVCVFHPDCHPVSDSKRFSYPCGDSLQPHANYLFLNLALADILVATFQVLQYIIQPLIAPPPPPPEGWPGTLLCKLLTGGSPCGWGGGGGCASSALHVAIAIERFYATRPDNLVRNKIRGTKLKLVVGLVWIFAVAIEVPPFLRNDL